MVADNGWLKMHLVNGSREEVASDVAACFFIERDGILA
jgi:hypothetical protein